VSKYITLVRVNPEEAIAGAVHKQFFACPEPDQRQPSQSTLCIVSNGSVGSWAEPEAADQGDETEPVHSTLLPGHSFVYFSGVDEAASAEDSQLAYLPGARAGYAGVSLLCLKSSDFEHCRILSLKDPTKSLKIASVLKEHSLMKQETSSRDVSADVPRIDEGRSSSAQSWPSDSSTAAAFNGLLRSVFDEQLGPHALIYREGCASEYGFLVAQGTVRMVSSALLRVTPLSASLNTEDSNFWGLQDGQLVAGEQDPTEKEEGKQYPVSVKAGEFGVGQMFGHGDLLHLFRPHSSSSLEHRDVPRSHTCVSGADGCVILRVSFGVIGLVACEGSANQAETLCFHL